MKAALLLLAAAALAILAPLVFQGGYAISLLTQMAIVIIFATSYSLLLGETGLLSFGHAVYYGAGAFGGIYALRMIAAGLPIPVILVPVFGGICALACGALAGALITRRSGTAFAMITLGIGELVHAAATMFKPVFGGEEGITASRTIGPRLLGFAPNSDVQLYVMVAGWALVSVALMFALTRTPLGRMANACRDNPERVAFVGYDPRWIRFMMFATSAFFAGIAGGLYAVTYEIVTTEVFSAKNATDVVLMTFIGGTSHLLGPVVGAILVTLMQTLLSLFSDAWQFYYGVLFVTFVLFAPTGFVGLIRKQARSLSSRGGLHKAALSYAALAPFAAMALAGAVLLIECAYRISPLDTRGGTLSAFGMIIPAGNPWLVGGALLLLLVGGFGIRRVPVFLDERWSAVPLARKGHSV